MHNSINFSLSSYSHLFESKTFLISAIIFSGAIVLVVFMDQVNRSDLGFNSSPLCDCREVNTGVTVKLATLPLESSTAGRSVSAPGAPVAVLALRIDARLIGLI